MLDALPTFEQLFRILPVSLIVLAVAFAGWWARGDSVKHLKAWIDELRNK